MTNKKEVQFSSDMIEKVTGIACKDCKDGITNEQLAQVAMAPAARSTITVKDFIANQYGKSIDAGELMLEINRQAKEIASDSTMERSQQLLASQAIALDTVFNSLAHKAAHQDTLLKYEAFMKLALKAQAQSRCTLEAITKMKNPPNATFVKQANISQGHQQINNTTTHTYTGDTSSPEVKSENQPNELLEAQHGERLDFGAQTTASRADQSMEAVDTIDWP
jgi:hypothetical protein